MNNASHIDRLPPASEEAEQGVLACCMIAPQESIPAVIDALGNEYEEAFYDARHRFIFGQMLGMQNALKPIDLITLQQSLKDVQMLENVGGITFLVGLQDKTSSAANLAYYLGIMKEKMLLRKTIQTCTSIVSRIYDSEAGVDELLNLAESEIMAISKSRQVTQARDIKTVTNDAINDLERRFSTEGTTGLPYGIQRLDGLTNGMHDGDMIVIAAYPSCGKTTLAMNIAEPSMLRGYAVGVFSLEMSDVSLVQRQAASLAKVNLRSFDNKTATQSDFTKIAGAITRIAKSKLVIEDISGISIMTLVARARRMKQRHDIQLLIIDYLQLLHAGGFKGDQRAAELDHISKAIKNLAKELKIPVVVLSQLNDSGKLKGSRAAGEDGDVLFLLSRENDETASMPVEPIELWIRKQRNGPANVKVDLDFYKEYTRFEQRPYETPPSTVHND